MSWSISGSGSKSEALESIRSQAANTPYKPGTPQGDDLVAAVARIEALTAALGPSEKVFLSAYGSHSTSSNGVNSASFSVSAAKST